MATIAWEDVRSIFVWGEGEIEVEPDTVEFYFKRLEGGQKRVLHIRWRTSEGKRVSFPAGKLHLVRYR